MRSRLIVLLAISVALFSAIIVTLAFRAVASIPSIEWPASP